MCLRLSCQFMAGFVALECARHLLCSCFSGSWEHPLDRIRLRGVGERSLVKRSMKSATWFISKFVAYCGKLGSWLVARIGITPCSGIYISFHQSKEQSCCSISNEDVLTRDFENGTSLTRLLETMNLPSSLLACDALTAHSKTCTMPRPRQSLSLLR